MEIRYKNNKKDIQTYAEYIFKNSVFNRKKFIYLNFFLIVFIIGIIYIQYGINDISGSEQCWIIVKALIIIIVIQYIFSKKYIQTVDKVSTVFNFIQICNII